MFEKYLEQKEQLLAEQLNLSDEYVNLYSMLFNPKIEQSFKVYFSAEVDWWIYEEQIARSSNQRFNIDDPKLSAFLKQLDELYKKNARFSSLTLPQVINSAVKTRLNMLCRPRTAIKWFVYRWEQTKSYHEIVKRLNYLFDNKYLADGFIEYVQRKNLIKSSSDLIPISEFDKIISEIDNEKIHSLSPEEFVQLMSSLFIFFNSEAEHKDTAKIPIEAVVIYFDDKNLFSLSTKLEQMFRSGELLLISKKYLLGFIYKSLYDADNLYGSDDDKVTKVTKEIEQANSNYLNMALSLKENFNKNQSLPDISEESYYSVENDYISQEGSSNEFNLPNSFDFNSKLSEKTELIEIDDSIIDENIDYSISSQDFESIPTEEKNEFESFDKIIEEEIVAEGLDASKSINIDNNELINESIENEFVIENNEASAESINEAEIDLSEYGFDIDGDSLVQQSVETEIPKQGITQSLNIEKIESPANENELLSEFSNSIKLNKSRLVDILSAIKDELND
jgi:hypothetical protein